MQQEQPDQQIISEIVAGNTLQYAKLVERHKRFAFTLAMRFTRNREDAEEVAQDSFVKAYRSLKEFKNHSKFSTWLYSIVYTTAMTFLRKKRLQTTSFDSEESFAALELSFVEDRCLIQTKQRSAYIAKAVSLLSPGDAAVVTLFYQGEQSLEEIGTALQMETNAVKVKLFRARQLLKKKLEFLLQHEASEL